MSFVVRTYFRNVGNHPLDIMVGQVRRLADELGQPGIVAKAGQTNVQVRRNGYLRTVWPSRYLAKKYQQLVAQFWGHHVTTRRFRV